MPAVESNGLFRAASRVLGGEEQRRLAVYADMTMSRQADKDPLESCSGLTGDVPPDRPPDDHQSRSNNQLLRSWEQ